MEHIGEVYNEMEVSFDSHSSNEAFARVTVAAFMTQLNPTVEEVSDVKTAVSEAVTNAIIHGYNSTLNKVHMEPLFTTKPDLERSGMGFSFMEAFMDELEVESAPGKGTTVKMKKEIGKGRELWTTQSL